MKARFETQTWPEAGDFLRGRPLLLLPIGSTEAHGPHLPLNTDVVISEGIAHRSIAPLKAAGFEARILPAIPYGLTDFGSPFPGNISISGETLKHLILDIVRSLILPESPAEGPKGTGGHYSRDLGEKAHEMAPGAIILINSHLEYPHVQVLRKVVKSLAEHSPVPVLFADNTRRRWVADLGDEFKSASCHAGRYETSLILAERPELVRDDRHGLPEVYVNLATAMGEGAENFIEAGAKSAYCGAPQEASAAEGEILYERLVNMVVCTAVEGLQPKS